ncbi:MAG: hypothetical protein IKO04_00570 [Bacteroidales bacterium]|nr:hypothetical protein [Bacteroidales bacterium]
MKKFLTLLAMASMFAFASCGPDNPDTPDNPDPGKQTPTLTLSAANIDVSGIDGDYMAVVDNAAKTIKISLEYADKENAKALTVSFLNIPEGFTTEYQKTFNYSNGATQTVTFKYEEKTAAEYVISVTIGAADPKFLTLTVNGIDALSGEVRMASAASLSHLPVEFTVDPEDVVVTVNGAPVASGDELDFNDKLNGVTFTLTLGEAVKTHKVVVITSGIRKANRVWAHYVQPKNVEDDWYATKTRGIAGWWQRTIAMDDQYVYIAQHGKDAVGPYVLSLADGSLVGTMSGEGIEGGTHLASAVRTIPDGNGYRILETNLAIGGVLKVYSWENKDSKPTVALEYNNTDGLRLGDKMTVIGTWQDGEIWFLSKENSPRKLYKFAIKNGVVNSTPTVCELAGMESTATYGQVYKFSDTEVVASAAGGRPVLYTVSGDTYTKALDFDTALFASCDEGINFFTFNDQKYMAFARLTGDLCDCSLRIIPITGETLQASLEGWDGTGVFTYGLSDPEEFPIVGYKSGNSLADCIVREIGGETYIAALSEGAGVSLFKLEE